MNFANEEQYRQLLDALLKVAPESTHDAIKDLAGHYRTSVEAAHAAGVSEGKEEGRAEGFAEGQRALWELIGADILKVSRVHENECVREILSDVHDAVMEQLENDYASGKVRAH